MPIAAIFSGWSFAFLSADRAHASSVRHISSGSCSTQPGWGKLLAEFLLSGLSESPAIVEHDSARVVVPWSSAST